MEQKREVKCKVNCRLDPGLTNGVHAKHANGWARIQPTVGLFLSPISGKYEHSGGGVIGYS